MWTYFVMGVFEKGQYCGIVQNGGTTGGSMGLPRNWALRPPIHGHVSSKDDKKTWVNPSSWVSLLLPHCSCLPAVSMLALNTVINCARNAEGFWVDCDDCIGVKLKPSHLPFLARQFRCHWPDALALLAMAKLTLIDFASWKMADANSTMPLEVSHPWACLQLGFGRIASHGSQGNMAMTIPKLTGGIWLALHLGRILRWPPAGHHPENWWKIAKHRSFSKIGRAGLDCKTISSTPIPVSEEAATFWSKFRQQVDSDKGTVPARASGAVGKKVTAPKSQNS